MLLNRNKNKAQSMVEYAVIVAIIAASLVLMSIYFKRGYSGYIKENSDNLGQQYDFYQATTTRNYTVDIEQTTESFMGEVTLPDGNSYWGYVSSEETTKNNTTQTFNQTIPK